MILNRFAVLVTLLSLCCAVQLSAATKLLTQSFQYPDQIIPITNGNLSIVSGPRDYWTIISFTSTDEKHACAICKDLNRVLGAVSNSWWADYADTSYNLFFLSIDIVDRSNIPLFDLLEFDSIPHIWLVSPNTNIDIAEENNEGYDLKILGDGHFVFKMPIASIDEQIMEFARFISDTTQKNLIVRTEDPTTKFVKTFGLTFFIIVLLKKKGPAALKNINRKYFASAFFILLTLTFVCGYAFTTSAGVPFLATGDKGETIYISGGIHYQFGVEIVIVGLNYLILAASLISLVYLGGYKVSPETRINSERLHFVLVALNSVFLYLAYSMLTSIFLRKDHDYPYGFTKLI